jgi:hypothetical protein
MFFVDLNLKVNVKLSLCLINKRHTMKTWRSGGIAQPFLTLALDGGEWSALRPSRFTPEE